MLTALALSAALLAPAEFNFYQYAPYDSAYAKPEATLGYGPGERHTTYMQQQAVLAEIEKTSGGRVKQFSYGKSTEGRSLRLFVVSSPDNMARLDSLREGWTKMAHGEDGGDLPALVWVNETIHGNESASFESAMWLTYTLAASRTEQITSMLRDAVVVINPCYNPDGHERFVVWYNSIAVGSPRDEAFEQNEPRIIHGRTNHYRFDMNRDRVAMSQQESIQEAAEVLRWNPQVYIDQHGEVDGYFFPPNSMATNAAMDRVRLEKWTDIFGRGNAKAFDANGWTYFVRDTFDFFFVGYLDTFAMLTGAIGMTYETNGGGVLARESDGEKVTLRDGIARHFTSAIATIETAAKNRKDLESEFVKYKKQNISGELAGNFKRVVVVNDDPRPLVRLAEQLRRMGLQCAFATKEFSQPDAHDYWGDQKKATARFPANSLIVDVTQPLGMMAKAVLEPSANFEKEFVDRQLAHSKEHPKDEEYPGFEGGEFYDITGWSIPYAHELKTWWCESTPQVPTVQEIAAPAPSVPESTVGWALRYSDRDDILAAFDLASQGVRVAVATRDIAAGNDKYGRGTFVFLKGRNDDDIRQKIETVATKRGVKFESLTSGYPLEGRDGPGSSAVRRIKKPEVGILFGLGDATTSFSSIWFLMEKQFALPFTPLSGFRNLDKYSCIVVPGGSRQTVTPQLKQWVQSGGCLVLLESPGWAIGKDKFVELDEVEADRSIPGTIFRAEMDERLFLAYGYPAGFRPAVPIDGSSFYTAKKSGGSVVTLTKDEKATKLLSGWAWPDDSEKALRGTVWLQDEPVGQGHVILFTNDPTSRAMWPGLDKMLLNAMLLGAG